MPQWLPMEKYEYTDYFKYWLSLQRSCHHYLWQDCQKYQAEDLSFLLFLSHHQYLPIYFTPHSQAIITSSCPYILGGVGCFIYTSFTVLGPYWHTGIMHDTVLFKILPWTKWFRCNTQIEVDVQPQDAMSETSIMKSHQSIIEILCNLLTIAI